MNGIYKASVLPKPHGIFQHSIIHIIGLWLAAKKEQDLLLYHIFLELLNEMIIGLKYRIINPGYAESPSETGYWLEIISELKWSDQKNTKLNLDESNELLAIFTSIGQKLKS